MDYSGQIRSCFPPPFKMSLDLAKTVSTEEDRENFHNDNAAQGTHYQQVLGGRAKRKHFFASLDQAFSEAVHKDAGTVEYTPEEEVGFLKYFTLGIGLWLTMIWGVIIEEGEKEDRQHHPPFGHL